MGLENKTGSALPVLKSDGERESCWSCGDMVAAHFCHACGKVQPPAPTDYFSFFGLSRRLNVDPGALEREMYSLSRHLHPDVYATATEQEQAWSLEQTSQLNDAYRTLRDPIARTQYLLKVEGFKAEDQPVPGFAVTKNTGQSVPPELLEEVFEVNLQLEQVRANRKQGQEGYALIRELQQAKHSFDQRLNNAGAELRNLWQQWDELVTQAESGEEVSALQRRAVCASMSKVLNQFRYVQNLLREITAALDE